VAFSFCTFVFPFLKKVTPQNLFWLVELELVERNRNNFRFKK
jgi:hypothetical protein